MAKIANFPNSDEYHIKQLEFATNKFIEKLGFGDKDNVSQMHPIQKVNWTDFRKLNRTQKINALISMSEVLTITIDAFSKLRDTLVLVKNRM
jgi:hypothetical protein